jgi:hypothetical protein
MKILHQQRRVGFFCLVKTGAQQTFSSPTGLAAGMELLMSLVNPIQEATVAGAAVTPGHALNYTQERKMRGAAEDCRRQGIAPIPLAADSLGWWSVAAEREVKELVAALARNTSQPETELFSHSWGRMATLLQKGNAAILTDSVPCFPDAAVDGLQ